MAKQFITANLAGDVRREQLHGRDYLVVPMTMLKQGVLNGSKGPLFYPKEEMGKNTAAWNQMPIVVYHPYKGGRPTTARQPQVFNESFVGWVFNAELDEINLQAEGWFDVERTHQVDPRVLGNIENSVPIELSTGLFTEDDGTPGEYEGTVFNATATNYKPDHLAILPDQKGACSLEDGCGVLVNEKSFTAIRDSLQKLWGSEDFGPPDEDRWVTEVFEGYFIAEKKGKLLKMMYSVEDELVKILDNTPVEVQLVTSYIPVTNVEDDYMAKLSKAKREEIIVDLITNCECWDDGDREMLEALPDAKLNAISDTSVEYRNREAVVNAAKKGFKAGNQQWNLDEKTGEFVSTEIKPEPTTNEEGGDTKPMTEKEWWDAAPDRFKKMVANADKQEKETKDNCIKVITANESNPFTKEQLEAMEVDQLVGIARLSQKPEQATQTPPAFNFSGAAPPPPTPKPEETEEPLEMPTMNYEDKALQEALGN